ncbi:MAG: metal-dependent hydrolase [Fervidobacterium sp.]
MPNLTAHLKFGMFSYPIYVFFYLFICNSFQLKFEPNIIDLAMSYLFYIVGSDLPDLDSNNAPLRSFVKAFSLGFSIYIFTDFIFKNIQNVPLFEKFKYSFLYNPFLFSLSISIAMLIGAGLINLFLSLPIFSHRGFAHSITFAVIYGLLIYLFTSSISKNPVFLGTSAFFGVMSHMVADYRTKPSKIFKLY